MNLRAVIFFKKFIKWRFMIFTDNSQRPYMYAIYVVVLFTTVKHPQKQSAGKLKRDKSIQYKLSLVKI